MERIANPRPGDDLTQPAMLPQLDLDAVCVPSQDVVAREIEGSVIIVPLASGIVDAEDGLYTLNTAGQAIWRKLDGQRTLADVAALLAAEFDAPLAKLENDVLEFARELTQRGNLSLKAGGIKRQHSGDLSLAPPPSTFGRAGGELRLTNLGQAELLRSAIERGLPLRTRVRGFSMHPFIRDEDVLTIAPLNGRAPRIGQVVAFVEPTGRLVVHRAIARVDSGYLIRGDNSPQADGVVAGAAILGVVRRVERNGRGVRLGLGAEARLVAWLQRAHLLGRAGRLSACVRRLLKAPRPVL